MPFTGRAEATIDAKQRLAIPAKFRSRWSPEEHGSTWFCMVWTKERVLRLYPKRTFEELFRAGRRAPSLTPSSDQRALEAALFSATEELDVDAQNRVRLPAWQLDKLKMPGEVWVLGVGDRLEIRPKDAWDASFDALLDDMDGLIERLERDRPE